MGYHQFQWYPMDHRQKNMAIGRTTCSDQNKNGQNHITRTHLASVLPDTFIPRRQHGQHDIWGLHRGRGRVARHLRHGPTTMSPCRTMMVSQSWVHLWMKEPWQWGLSGEVTMYIFIYLFIFLFIYLFIYLFIHLFIHLFINLLIYIYIYLYTYVVIPK